MCYIVPVRMAKLCRQAAIQRWPVSGCSLAITGFVTFHEGVRTGPTDVLPPPDAHPKVGWADLKIRVRPLHAGLGGEPTHIWVDPPPPPDRISGWVLPKHLRQKQG